MTPVERVPYDEFSMFHENASEFGLPYDGPPAVRRLAVEVEPGRHLSALVWGEAEPELVFLHGGAQNAHTWDTVALALDRPLVAVDLPGHGHSDGGRTGLDPASNARDVAVAVRELAPRARAVVGMSLGGMTSLALAATAPELVRSLVLVDITPGVDGHKASAITAFIDGPESFESFDELLARTIAFNPTRSSRRCGGASCTTPCSRTTAAGCGATPVTGPARPGRGRRRFSSGRGSAAVRLAVGRRVGPGGSAHAGAGMLPQSVVDDADEAELVRRCPHARIEHVEGAGHSVQGDKPVELAALVADFVATASAPAGPTGEEG